MIPFSVTVLRGQQVRSGEQLAAAEGEGWGRGGKEAGMATEGQCGGGGVPVRMEMLLSCLDTLLPEMK